MTQQRLIPRRVLLGVPIVMHGQRHAVGAMPLRRSTQFPHGVLPAFAQTGKALGEAQRHVFPVRVGQHEVVKHMGKRLTLNGHAQLVHVGEIRRAQPARFMHLAEEHFLGRTMRGLPLPDAPFHRPSLLLPVLARVLALQPLHQSLGLQPRLALQQLLERRPDVDERIRPGPPCVRRRGFAGELAPIAILACRLAIHTRFHRRVPQRCSLVEVTSNFLDLGIGHLASSTHWQLLWWGSCQCSRLQLRG
jgi:hypothetical protein